MTAVPVSIILSIFVKKIKKVANLNISNLFKNLVILQSVLILSISYFVKYNSTLIDKNLIKSFQNLEEPKSGYIILYSDKLSRNYYNLNYILYKSYSKAAWLAEIQTKDNFEKISSKDFYNKNIKEILSKQAYPVKHIMNEQVDKCLTTYQLDEEIYPANFIKKLYFLNQKNFFVLKKIYENC